MPIDKTSTKVQCQCRRQQLKKSIWSGVDILKNKKPKKIPKTDTKILRKRFFYSILWHSYYSRLLCHSFNLHSGKISFKYVWVHLHVSSNLLVLFIHSFRFFLLTAVHLSSIARRIEWQLNERRWSIDCGWKDFCFFDPFELLVDSIWI